MRLRKKKKGGDSMSTRQDRLTELVAENQHMVQRIIESSDDSVTRIYAREILRRDQEIAEILNLTIEI
jgi:hypothetical protein